MFYKTLQIRNFRNISKLDVELGANCTVIFGENGQGKTNFLESLVYLISGKSFRTSQKEVLINNITNNQNPSGLAQIFGKIQTGLLEDQLECSISTDKRILKKNGAKINPTELRCIFPHVFFSPDSLLSIKLGPEYRRELLDDFIESTEEYGVNVVYDYKKTLLTRNKIIREIVIKQKDNRVLLESINPIFIRAATLLTKIRIEILDSLNPIINKIYSEITNKKNVDIFVEYVSSGSIGNKRNTQEIYDAINQNINKQSEREIKAQSSLFGPHKDDIRFLYNGKDSRFFCSQGQQRALILSFKISQIVYHRQINDVSPILFLDDVLSELDEEKREYLIRFLQEHDSQTFITTTDYDKVTNIKKADVDFFQMKNGNLERWQV